jgi:hypothetical protein
MRVAQDVTPTPAPAAEPASEHRDRWLDQALEETFPASDPIAAHSFD